MPRTVLLADDSVTAQNMGRRILTDAGYEVITVNNGSAALKKIHEVRPDLIVLDVYMPGYGGLEVCQRLKESGDTSRIPVLLTVGKMEPFKADEAKRVRADAHIVKPFEASELLAALAKLEDRIVPQAEPARGRKSKKPSFWHEEEVAAPRDWTDNAEYLAQVKQRKASDITQTPVEFVSEPAASTEAAPQIGAFPLVPEAKGELPVIAEPSSAPTDGVATAPADAFEVPAIANPANLSEPAVPVGPETVSDHDSVAETQDGGSKRAETATSANGRWIAENVALTAEEAALELEQEMRTAGTASAQPVASADPTPAPSLEAEAPETRGATFAAAAGASGSTATTAVGVSEESEPAVAAETVAAWHNWQQIRETVMNVHSPAATAENAAEVTKAIAFADSIPSVTPVNTAPEASPEPSSTDSTLEDGALSSMVDTMLAELKPKLMKEIAKKLKK